MQRKLCGIMSTDFDVKGQLLIKQLINKKENTMRKCMLCLQTFKKACYSVRREVLYNIPMVFGNPMKLRRLIKCDQMKHAAESE
jgi:hypothetical protein